jgi:6-phosphogluconolactonase (cycloisomerase 2 family)
MRARLAVAFLPLLLAVFSPPVAAQSPSSVYLFLMESKGVPTGTIHVYAVNSSSGALAEVPGSPFDAGFSPIGIAVDPSGRFFYVVNEISDDITGFSVDPSTGTLTPLPGSPFLVGGFAAGEQPHAIAIDPTGRFLYIATSTDTAHGLIQNFHEFTIDNATGVLTAAPSSPDLQGELITSIAFDSGGNYAYVGRSGMTSTKLPILVCSVDFISGLLTQVGLIPVASGDAYQAVVHPSDKFLYSLNELGQNRLDAFILTPADGLGVELPGSPYTVGLVPRDLVQTPSGGFLYAVNENGPYQTTSVPSQYDGSISAFTVDSETGALTEVAGSPFAAGINPISMAIDPTGHFAYASSTSYTTGYESYAQILGYVIDPSSGVLTPFSSPAWTDSAQFSNGYKLAISSSAPALPNPVPLIDSLSPSSATADGAAFTLQVNGANFVPGAKVYFDGQARNTTFVSTTQLNADIPASDIANGRTGIVFVFNPLPGGGASTSVTFTVFNPTPSVSSITPSTVTAGGSSFTLTVNGSNFVTSSVVNFNGSGLPTAYVSSEQITAEIPVTGITSQGTANITVTNPSNGVSGGGTSSPVTLTILPSNTQPTVATLIPASAIAGSGQFTLTVNGGGFVQTSQVSFNLVNVATTFVSSTQLTAVIPASDITIAGNPYVIVTNPGGLVSALLTFTVNNPQPGGGTVSPPSLPAGSAALTLNVSGTGFAPGSVVLVNGDSRATTFVSTILLMATLLPADLSHGGTLNITVMNPPPGGGTTAEIAFSVADYAVSASSSAPPVVAGQMATFTMTVSPSGAFSDPVTFTAAPLPAGTSAAFSPSATIIPGANPQTVTLSISTTAHTTAGQRVPPGGTMPTFPVSRIWIIAFGGMLAMLALIPNRKARMAPQFVLASLLLMAAGLTACGSAATSTPSGQQVNLATGTPAGTYPITVTATSGGVSHTTTVTLIVN